MEKRVITKIKLENAEKETKGHSLRINCLSYSPDGNYLISGSKDQNFIVWNTKTGEHEKIIEGQDGLISSVSISPDGKYIASTSLYAIKFWNAKTGTCVKTINGRKKHFKRALFSPKGSYFAFITTCFVAEIWNTENGLPLKKSSRIKKSKIIAYSHDDSYLASGGEENLIHIFESKTAKCVMVIKVPNSNIRFLQFSPNGESLLTSNGGFISTLPQSFEVWSVATGLLENRFVGHENCVTGISFSSQGDLLASCSFDETVRIWNTKTGKCIRIYNLSNSKFTCISFSPNKFALSIGEEENLLMLDLMDEAEESGSFQLILSHMFDKNSSFYKDKMPREILALIIEQSDLFLFVAYKKFLVR